MVALALLVAGVLFGSVRPAGAQQPPEDAPTYGHVGDSIPFEALFHFDTTVERDRRIVFSEVGLAYRIRDVLPGMREAVREGRMPDILVAFIGTSESQSDPPSVWREELIQMMDLASPHVGCIRVFEMDDDRTGYYRLHDRNAATYNRITHQVVDRYPNAEWFHYELWAGLAGPEFERRDTLHHNMRGRVQIARLMRAAANSCDPAFTTGPFWDVPDGYPAAEAIAWVGERNLFPGYANHTYRAQIGSFVLDATRGALLNMAWKLAGRPTGFGPHPWSDGRPALEPALRWAHGARVGAGFPDGTYRPDARVTRGQALALLWRMAGRPGGYPDDPWEDADGPSIRWAAAHHLLGPLRPGEFRPDSTLTRAQAATVLFRFDALPD